MIYFLEVGFSLMAGVMILTAAPAASAAAQGSADEVGCFRR
jgi:hypothetical protein